MEAQWTSRHLNLHSFVTCQDEYSLVVRDIEKDLLPAAQQYNLGLLPFFPLASGLLTGKYKRGEAPAGDTRFGKVPALVEVLPNFERDASHGILAPAGTPAATLQRLHEEIAKAVASDDVRQQYIKVALDPVTMGPKEYRELLEREIAKYQRIGREAKIEKL